MSAFDDVVGTIMAATGVGRARAEEVARLNGHVPPAPDPAEQRRIERDARVLEQAEQAEVVKRFRVCRFRVYNLSQARRSKQSEGLPDLWLLSVEHRIALWWETKRQVGRRYSDEQRAFADQCRQIGAGYGTGDRYDAEEWLITHGFAQRVAGTFEPVRRSAA